MVAYRESRRIGSHSDIPQDATYIRAFQRDAADVTLRVGANGEGRGIYCSSVIEERTSDVGGCDSVARPKNRTAARSALRYSC